MKGDGHLRELCGVKQTEPGVIRRFFSAGDDDLTVWYDPAGAIIGFQLTVGGTAVTWAQGGFSIRSVDFCEKDNLAPVLKGEASLDRAALLAYLERHGAQVDQEITEYMVAVICRHMKA